MELELRINGVVASLGVAANETLLSLLRREGYTGVKQGCETGECGACTVLVDGVPRPSCVMLAAQAGGCTLTTVEGIGSSRKLHPLQEAFAKVGAVQCGFCTSGMLLSAYALLKRNPRPTESEVRDALSGNLCRCTGYAKPVQAVLQAAAIMRGESPSQPEYSIINHKERKDPTGKHRVVSVPGGSSAATAKIPAVTVGAVLANAHLDAGEVAGKPIPDIDAVKLVTGKATFAADITPRNLLYGRILTSPHAHAIIHDIDVSAAKSLPGVHAVLTYKDLPRIAYSSVERAPDESGPYDQYSLDYLMRYAGDRVAVVAAETPEIAEQALSLIQVEYDVLPSILDPRQALEANAPRLHPESESRGIFDATRNVAARVRTEVGDVERGFAEADVIVEGEYLMPAMQQAPLEKHTVITYFDEDDCLVVRTSTQVPHHVRRTLARLLNMPAHRIRVVKPEVGGGFGVKQAVVLEDLCALLTTVTERPVMLAYSSSEALSGTPAREQHVIRLKTGVKRDGTIVANQMVVLASTGAYGTHPLTSQYESPADALVLYPCQHMRYVAEVLYTNQPPSGAFRGYGAIHESFALECHMDEIARRLGIDALELRRKNWLKAGDLYPFTRAGNRDAALPIVSCGLPECLRVVEEKLQWQAKRGRVSNDRTRKGVGVALSLHGNPVGRVGTGGAIMKLNENGSFDIFTNAAEGGSSSKTILVQIAAEVLTVPIGTLTVHSTGSDMLPADVGESALSALYLSGGAVKKAAEQMRRQILAVGGRFLNALPETLKINGGIITAPNGQTATIEQVATYSLYVENRHIMTTASWKVPYTPTTFSAQGVEVEVDTETGCVRVLTAIAAVDAGRIINPMIVEGQIQGAIARGLGSGICEEMMYNQKGEPLVANFSDYHIYSALDMPELQTYLVETDDPAGPFGAKALAEIPLHGMAPAIVNAVTNALGIPIRQLPLTPERVLRAIHAQSAKR